MTISRYLKKFKTWMSCAYKADKGTAGYEYPHERYVIYHYVYYGSAKIAKPFTDDVTIIKANGKLIDVKKFYKQHNIFHFSEDTSMWGFNKMSDGDDWNGELLGDGKIKINSESVLVCLDGEPVVNNIKLRKYDFDELSIGKEYDIMLNSGVLALFTKI